MFLSHVDVYTSPPPSSLFPPFLLSSSLRLPRPSLKSGNNYWVRRKKKKSQCARNEVQQLVLSSVPLILASFD